MTGIEHLYLEHEYKEFHTHATAGARTIPVDKVIQIPLSPQYSQSWDYLRNTLNLTWKNPDLVPASAESPHRHIKYPTNQLHVVAELQISGEIFNPNRIELISGLLSHQIVPLQSLLYLLAYNPELYQDQR